MKTIQDVGEKKLISSYVRPLFQNPHLEVGPGDDAAVLSLTDNISLVVTTDKIPEKLFGQSLGVMTYKDVGRYLIAASLSDLAAMGASPMSVLVSLTLPGNFPVVDFRRLLAGIAETAQAGGASVAGGDTKEGSSVSLVATAIGSIKKGLALRRDGAAVGDLIFSTGSPGTFGAALAYLVGRELRVIELSSGTRKSLLRRLTNPEPRIEQGRLLAELGFISACQDVSDGLGQTLIELAEASGVGFNVFIPALRSAGPPAAAKIATSCGCSLETILLGPGADFELTFTARERHREVIMGAFIERGWPLSEIGRIEDAGYIMTQPGCAARTIPQVGWSHFRGLSDLETVKRLYIDSEGWL